MRKPPPPMLPAEGWVTASANAVATAASTAFPPSHRTSTPTWEATKFWEATIPLRARAGTEVAVAEPAVARTPTAASNRSLMFSPRACEGDTNPVLIPFLLAAAAAAAAAAPPAAMRLDYFHTGDAREERFPPDAVVREGPWSVLPDRRLDDTGRGRYQSEV